MPQGTDLHEGYGPMPIPPLLWLRSKQLIVPIVAFSACMVALLLTIILTL
jgi:hypothetical protein